MIKTKVLLSQEEVIVGDIGYLVYPFGLLFPITFKLFGFQIFLNVSNEDYSRYHCWWTIRPDSIILPIVSVY